MKYFTSDWHHGEEKLPNTHSYLRTVTGQELFKFMIKQVKKLSASDTLVFNGDVAITLEKFAEVSDAFKTCRCKKILIIGDKENANKNFIFTELESLGLLNCFDNVELDTSINVNDISYYVVHKPLDGLSLNKPVICGHIHGVWKTQKMPNNNPIINVGIDAWVNQLVTESYIQHQYNAISKGYYDKNCQIQEWYK